MKVLNHFFDTKKKSVGILVVTLTSESKVRFLNFWIMHEVF